MNDEFVREMVIGFGFLEGLWLHIGFSPDSLLFSSLSSIAKTGGTDFLLLFVSQILPILVTITTLAIIYFQGGRLGLLCVGLAFFGGLFIATQFGVYLLLIGMILGYFIPLNS